MNKKKIISMIIASAIAVSIVPTTVFAEERYEVLARGDEDQYVMQAQEALYDKGLLKAHPTGYYGTDTMAAIMEFQNENKLTVDAVAGPETLKLLLGDSYKALPSTRKTSDADPIEVLYPGAIGDNVLEMQQLLNKLGYLFAQPTGYYGTETEDAVSHFQKAHGIPDDGVFGEMTKAMLYSQLAETNVVEQDTKSNEVVKIQTRLKELGYFSGTTTGYYGPVTVAAVKKFQQVNSLTADGKTGPYTVQRLFAENAKKNTSSSNNSSNKKTTTTKTTTKATSKAEIMIDKGYDLKGKRYVYGATGPNAFDCSGFVYTCLKSTGISVSRTSSGTYASNSSWDKISYGNLKRGDLVFFSNDSSSSVSHIGIYIGAGKMIHCAPSIGGVGISSITSGYYRRNFVCGRRVF